MNSISHVRAQVLDLVVQVSGDLLRWYVLAFSPTGSGAGPRRGIVLGFSPKSMRRMEQSIRERVFSFIPRTMITLTFAEQETSPEDAKRHLHRWRQTFRRTWPAAAALWFLEFQARGTPHFHLITDAPYLSHARIASTWAEGFVWVSKAHSGSARYALKSYGTKSEQKDVPRGTYWTGRFWGWINPPPRVAATTRINIDESSEDVVSMLTYLDKQVQISGEKHKTYSSEELKKYGIDEMHFISERNINQVNECMMVMDGINHIQQWKDGLFPPNKTLPKLKNPWLQAIRDEKGI